jgi:hypothetical protein
VLLRSLTVALLLAGGEAAAERAIAVELDPGVPLSESELADALRVRIAATGGPVHVTVKASERGVVVGARGASRVVDLGDRRGGDAARLVALAAVDLLFDDLAAPPTPAVVAKVAPRVENRWTVGLVGMAAQWSGTLAGAALDVRIPHGAWFAAVDAGGGELVDGTLHLTGGVVRASVGRRMGRLDLRGGATVAPINVANGAGDATVLVGAGVSARVRFPVDAFDLVLAVGADGFATRTEYRIASMTIATPWLAPWVGVGIEVTP